MFRILIISRTVGDVTDGLFLKNKMKHMSQDIDERASKNGGACWNQEAKEHPKETSTFFFDGQKGRSAGEVEYGK